ncbi:dapdiamide synthesis protein DdaC-like [Ptychodera flava]|uniref:dapdiamide synthesis protein DdaC-like n=1 Tax=Ptychodera flava TaxID=63121 RepID=UPI00396A4E42
MMFSRSHALILTIPLRLKLQAGRVVCRTVTSTAKPRELNDGFAVRSRLDVPEKGTPAPRIAGRKWLPGSTFQGHELPEFLAGPKDNMPAVYEAVGTGLTLREWSDRCRRIMDDKLHVYGTILFRGLPLESGDDFSRFFREVGYRVANPAGRIGRRREVASDVFTASDNNPPAYTLEPHNEMAYTKNYPMKIFFYCQVPAEPGQGGETCIADNRDILPRLDPKVVQKFEKLGIKYHYYVASKAVDKDAYLSWQSTFGSEDKAVVEECLREQECEYKWQEDDSLIYWRYRPPFITHPKTGEKVWFNQLVVGHVSYYFDHPAWVDKKLPYERYPENVYYGDGSEIEPEVIQHIRDVTWQETVGFQLQKGDVLAFDNIYAHHGRIGFDCERVLYVGMTSE